MLRDCVQASRLPVSYHLSAVIKRRHERELAAWEVNLVLDQAEILESSNLTDKADLNKSRGAFRGVRHQRKIMCLHVRLHFEIPTLSPKHGGVFVVWCEVWE